MINELKNSYITIDANLLKNISSGEWHNGMPDKVAGISFDSRIIRPNELFIALKTDKRDGHEFVSHAKKNGAIGAIVKNFNETLDLPQLVVEDPLNSLQKIAARHRQHFDGHVIGITGSCGKTSTKEMLSLLLDDDVVCKTQGNYNNHIGVPLSLLNINTQVHKYAVIEVGTNSPGEIEALTKIISPTASITTKLAKSHLEGLGSIEAIAEEKSKLALNTRLNGWSLLPEECLAHPVFETITSNKLIISAHDYDEAKSNSIVNYQTETIPRRPDGGCLLKFQQSPYSDQKYFIPFMSPGMMRNTVMAITLATIFGIDQHKIQKRLIQWKPAKHRGEIFRFNGKQFYVDCYNANPASMSDAFEAFHNTFSNPSPRLYLLGSMSELGKDSSILHQETGNKLELRPQDKVVLIGENSNDFKLGMLEKNADENQIKIVDDLKDAVTEIENFQGAVLVKGSRIYRLEDALSELSIEHFRKLEEAC